MKTIFPLMISCTVPANVLMKRGASDLQSFSTL